MAADTPRSVLMTADTVGGVWTYAAELSRALAAQGWHVHLATMGAPVANHQREQVQGLAGVTLHESHWRLEWMQAPWDDVDRAGRWLQALEAELQPDVIHLNQFAFGALAFRAPTLLVAHSCVLSWWRAVHGGDAPAEWDVYRHRVALGLQKAGRVAAPTQAMLDTLAQNYGFTGPGLVLPNARDPRVFAPAAKEPFILAAGRLWDEAKNLAALEVVAPALPWPVRAAGSCTGPEGGVRQPQAVEALGELTAPALAQTMARAAIYALPARYEPFGLSVLEAALCGCALVLGDIPSLREVWGEAASYVPVHDHEALRQRLQALIDDPGERCRLGRAARERALDFQPDRAVRAIVAAYAGLQPRLAHASEEELTCA